MTTWSIISMDIEDELRLAFEAAVAAEGAIPAVVLHDLMDMYVEIQRYPEMAAQWRPHGLERCAAALVLFPNVSLAGPAAREER